MGASLAPPGPSAGRNPQTLWRRGKERGLEGDCEQDARPPFVILRQAAQRRRSGDPAAPKAICAGTVSATGSRSRAPLGPPVSLRSPEDDEGRW